jgi:hypothetical protein
MPSGTLYSPKWRGFYPHMREADRPLWNRFLDRYGEEFEGFEYDVRVGTPSRAAVGMDPQTQAVWEALTQLRIDAVGHKPSEVWLFEVKPYAGISSVGQLLGYRALYVRDRAPVVPVRMGVVTDRWVPAVGDVFRAVGIQVWLV